MIELRISPFKPGKCISSSCREFYHLYKDGKIVDRTLYTKCGYMGDENKNLLVLNRRTITEIKPRILDSCRKHHRKYPRYTMADDIVIVSGETGKIIFDTNDSCNYISDTPYIISDYIFKYENGFYNDKGELIKKFTRISRLCILENTIIVLEGNSYDCKACYVFDKYGKLINEYK